MKFAESHEFFFNLYIYVYQRLCFCSYSKRRVMLIESTFYLILIPDPDDDDDDEMSGEATFNGLHQQSKYFGFLASVFCCGCVKSSSTILL